MIHGQQLNGYLLTSLFQTISLPRSLFISLFSPSCTVEVVVCWGGAVVPAHLEAVEGSVVFQGQDVVRDGEDVALGADESSDVHGFSCTQGRTAQEHTAAHSVLNAHRHG